MLFSRYWNPTVLTVGGCQPKAFDKEDHERLADMLNSLYTGFDGPDMIITYDQCPEIEALYPWADVQHVGRIYSCKRQGK